MNVSFGDFYNNPSSVDALYFKALEDDNMDMADMLVKQEAKKKGYHIGPVYHGSQKVFHGHKFDLSRTTMGRFDAEAARGVISFAFDEDFGRTYAGLQSPYHFPGWKETNPGKNYKCYLKAEKIADFTDPAFVNFYIQLAVKNHLYFLLNGADKKRWGLLDADGNLDENAVKKELKKFALDRRDFISHGDWGFMEKPKLLKQRGYDAAFMRESQGHHNAHITNICVFNSNQAKLADTVTYDRNPENLREKVPIPLSKRFDSSTDDFRY
jgi:hypothetical protein